MAFTAREVILILLEMIAITSCSWGMYFVYGYSSTPVAIAYNGLWFILGVISNILGIVSIFFYNFDSDQEMELAHMFLQYHYLTAWFCVILGYQSLVANTWMVYTGSSLALLHSLLSLLPLISWFTRQNRLIVLSTQGITAIALLSHCYICYLANNTFGQIGAAIMIFNVTSLSLPTRHSFVGITSRESFIIGLALASYVFSLAVEDMSKHPTVVKSFVPW